VACCHTASSNDKKHCRQKDRTATLHSSDPSIAGFCLRHELFTAGGLRCKSGAGGLTFDTGAHYCILRTHGDGGGTSGRSVRPQHKSLPEMPLSCCVQPTAVMPSVALICGTTASDKCTWTSWKERHSCTLSATNLDV
jgi:hypothetical protein